jgi:hypothetical protein
MSGGIYLEDLIEAEHRWPMIEEREARSWCLRGLSLSDELEGLMKRSRTRRDDELQVIPGIGPSLAADLRDLGIGHVADLKRRDPERMYQQLNTLRGVRQDPCVLYVFRCAVYFARTSRPKPELLKWWNWKGRTLS